jgi:hypothetical protein
LETRVWSFFSQRLSNILDADGFFPLAVGRGGGDAIIVPFRFRACEPKIGKVRDRSGSVLKNWSVTVARLEKEYGGDLGVQLLVEFGRRRGEIDGASFGLALVVAKERGRCISVGEYSPLDVLATGAFRAGHLAEVEELDAKGELARRMGVKLFIAPSMVAGLDSNFVVSPGLSIPDCIQRIGAELDRRCLSRLDFHGAKQNVARLWSSVHNALLPMEEAGARVQRYEAVFRSARHPAAVEMLNECVMLRAAIANHRGDPATALLNIDIALRSALKEGNPLNYVSALASQVVSLTDLGALREAEVLARHLLEWVEGEFRGSAETRIRCRMIIHGVLGGQPLLYRALRDPSCSKESLEHLEAAVEQATNVNDPSEICRDIVQVALWYALLKPEVSFTACEDAEARMRKLPGWPDETSLAYLSRARWLGAFRGYLLNATIPADFRSWSLPNPEISHASWLFATALKYRSTLVAAVGEGQKAEGTFTQACGLLERAREPLLRFIGATTALQAGESLFRARRSVALDFLHRAKGWFSSFNSYFHDRGWVALWQQRCAGLLKGESSANLPNPQANWPY